MISVSEPFQQKEASVFVADVAGFSALMSAWIEEDSRGGAERAGTLIEALFSQLSETLSARSVHMGGFAGDAITFWQEAGSSPLSLDEFRRLVEEAVAQSGEPFVLRVGKESGAVWAGHIPDGRSRIPVLWGEPITAAFKGLAIKTSASLPEHPQEARAHSLARKSVAAAVFARWTFFIQLLTMEEIAGVTPELIANAWGICEAIIRHYGGDCENLRQDDKGLAISAGIPDPEGNRQHVADECATELMRALKELALDVRIASAHGLVFRSPYAFAGNHFAAIQGTSVNAAAKSLVKSLAEPSVAAFTTGQRENTPSSPSQATVARDVVGREEERAQIIKAIEAGLVPKNNAFVYLHGDAGTGKTTLLDEILSLDQHAALRFWRCRLRPSDAYVPFAALEALLVFTGGEKAAFASRAEWLTHFENAAMREKAMLIVDDWQWIDPESRNVVLALMRSKAFDVAIFSSRTAPDFDNIDHTEIVALSGLSDAATQRLLEEALDVRLTAEELSSVRLIARGNPFWVLEFGAMLKANQTAELRLKDIDQREWSPEMLLRIRANGLSREAKALWRFFCAWQSPVTVADARASLEKLQITPSDVHLAELLDLGWLMATEQASSAAYAPAHQVLADWGCSDVPPTFELSLNRLIAHLLTRQSADAARIARHWQVARSDGRASIWYEKAALSAFELGAHSLSLDLIQLAEGLYPASASSRAARQRRRDALMISSEWGIGNMIAARRVLRQYETPDMKKAKVKNTGRLSSASDIQVEFVRAEIGQFSGNLPMILKGLRRGTMEGDGEYGKAVAKARRAGFVYYMFGLLGVPVGAQFERLIGESKLDHAARAECMYLNAYAALLLGKCDWRKAAPLLARARELTANLADVQVIGTALTLAAHCSLYSGDGATCAKVFRLLREEVARQPHRMMATWAVYGEAQGHVQLGDWETALPMLQQARVMNIGSGDHQSTVIIEGLLARAAMKRHDEAAALRHARKALRICRKLSKSNFTSMEGFAAPSHVAAHLAALHGPTPALTKMYREGRQHLAGYARGFPLAKPRLLAIEGIWNDGQGKRDQAVRKLEASINIARKLNMGYEAALSAETLEALA